MNSINPALIVLLSGLVLWGVFDRLIDERDRAQFEASGLREAARISGEMLADRDENDRTRTEALNHALSKNADLQRVVADGRTAELAADARPDYFTLRNQLALSHEMILGLQDHVRRICLR